MVYHTCCAFNPLSIDELLLNIERCITKNRCWIIHCFVTFEASTEFMCNIYEKTLKKVQFCIEQFNSMVLLWFKCWKEHCWFSHSVNKITCKFCLYIVFPLSQYKLGQKQAPSSHLGKFSWPSKKLDNSKPLKLNWIVYVNNLLSFRNFLLLKITLISISNSDCCFNILSI